MSNNIFPEDLLKKVELLESKNKKRTIVILSIIVLVALAYILFTVFYTKNQDNQIKILKEEVTITDSITKSEDTIRAIINNYFNAQNDEDKSAILGLLSDTVIRYYLTLGPISKTKLNEVQNFEINKNGKYQIDTNYAIQNIQDTVNIFVRTPSFDGQKSWITVHEMKLNQSNKIIYVRAYEGSSKNQDKVKKI